MNRETRPCWGNVAAAPDSDMLAIDALEDALAPLSEDTRQVRTLISTLELCHHKAERRVELVLQAIGAGKTDKRQGQRPAGSMHPVEEQWRRCCDALRAWREGREAQIPDEPILSSSTRGLVSRLGTRTALKVWQTRRVEEKIQSFRDRNARYREIAVECPAPADHEHWKATVETAIHDRVDGSPAVISLAAAIDHLEPCHWNFVHNLEVALDAIDGRLQPVEPFGACGRNICLAPWRDRMRAVSATLRHYCGLEEGTPTDGVDDAILRVLGPESEVKRWLALSLEKTIRSQLRP